MNFKRILVRSGLCFCKREMNELASLREEKFSSCGRQLLPRIAITKHHWFCCSCFSSRCSFNFAFWGRFKDSECSFSMQQPRSWLLLDIGTDCKTVAQFQLTKLIYQKKNVFLLFAFHSSFPISFSFRLPVRFDMNKNHLYEKFKIHRMFL